jgi:hypothetical protein
MTQLLTGVRTATVVSVLLLVATAARSDNAVETIVLIRHGEKPDQGLGQLNCQGLNRALALPQIIARRFGKPDFIFTPNPSDRKMDAGVAYDYVRPLATVEPTAISFGLPVDTSLGISDTARLPAVLEQPMYHNALTLVAWEHKTIETIAGALLANHGGSAAVVPPWPSEDFDSIYVVTIVRNGDTAVAKFAHESEGLDGQPKNCPHDGGN